MPMTAAEKITKARTQLLLNQPFFGALALKLTVVEAPWCGTFATDGFHLFYAPQFVDSLQNMGEIMACVAHEVMHCAMQHSFRRGQREPQRWNIAGDQAINPIIKDSGFQLPSCAIYPTQPQWGWPAEQLYNTLPVPPPCPVHGHHGYQMPQQQGAGQQGQQGAGQPQQGGQGGQQPPQAPQPQPSQQGGKGKSKHSHAPGGTQCTCAPSGHCGGIFDKQGASAADIAEAQSQWDIAVIQAAQIAKQAGKLPAGLEHLLDRILKPQIDWKDVLRRFLTTHAKNDYRMLPPNRRFVTQGVYLPSLRSEDMGEIVVAIDTSGSVWSGNPPQVMIFISELNAILEECKPAKVTVIYCDAAVAGVDEFTPDMLPLSAHEYKVKGGGGTSFEPPFTYVAEQGLEPVCMIYLTDMYGQGWDGYEPEFPTLWVATSDIVAPWGETVRINENPKEDGD